MPQCQFIYRRSRGQYSTGERCNEIGALLGNTLCRKHHNKNAQLATTAITRDQDNEIPTRGINNSFPRTLTDMELRECVTEARLRTSPEHVGMCVCAICGRLQVAKDLIYRTAKEVKQFEDLLHGGNYYNRIPSRHFLYDSIHQELNGLVIDRLGFLCDEELSEGMPLMIRICKMCNSSLIKDKVPDLALANRLWSGVGAVPELSGLSWIEEKLIARCHVSIQVQKCREIKQWHIDRFQSQRRLKGNISTFPMSPTVMLNKLPLSGGEMTGLVKVVFMSSRRRITLEQACRMRFFIVRRRKVEVALRWLIENNPLYQEVELCEETLSSLPTDGIPSEVYDSITFCDKVVEDMMGRSRYDKEDDEEPDEVDSDVSVDKMDDVVMHNPPSYDLEVSNDSMEIEELPEATNGQSSFKSMMQCCGIIDVEGTTVSNEAKVFQALNGIYIPHTKEQHGLLPDNFPSHLYRGPPRRQQDDLIEIPHGDMGFANEYDTNHIMNAFPTLYPYGIGGFGDVARQIVVSWERQAASHLLQSHRLFARHEVFMFVIFNFFQRREICLGAKLYTKHSSLLEVRGLLQKVDYKEVHDRLLVDIASGSKQSFSDPLLNQLMQATSVANGMVRGSREYVTRRRSEIMGLFVSNGAPTFFVTINPDDTKHPLMVSLWCGATGTRLDIPMRDGFVRYHQKRLQIISEDPVLQALFFDVIFSAVIDVVFGFDKEPKVGVLGEVSAYYAVIESQGKGTLHAHGLIWLTDVTNPRDLQHQMSDEGFRDRLTVYLENVIKLDFDWNDEPDEIEVHGKAQWEHPSYQFPNYDVDENGRAVTEDEWMARFLYDAKSIAAVTETHKHTVTCRKKGTACRFGFGGSGKALVEHTIIDAESGKIEIKRANAKANNHNPAMAVVTRSNHDLKVTFTSGYKSLQSLYYMTSYTSKFEDDTSDILAMDSAFKALESENLLSSTNAKERIRRLLIRMNYIRHGSLQFSGAQVAGMLLGIGHQGTHYTASIFCRINLHTYINYIQKALGDFRVMLTIYDVDISEEQDRPQDVDGIMENDNSNETEEVELDTVVTKLPRSIEDYVYRGDRLQNYSLYEIHRKAECVPTSVPEKEKYFQSISSRETHRGRPYNERVCFQGPHSCESSQWMMIRSKQVVPCILGPSIPHSDDTLRSEKRGFLTLLLFKPWRLPQDLKEEDQTWTAALTEFQASCVIKKEHERVQFMTNIDTLTKSKKDAEEERLEREKEREMAGNHVLRVMRYNPRDREGEDEIDDMSHFAQDSRIPLERYLMYQNPRVKSFPTQRFVSAALSAGRLLQLLPSFGEAHRCLNAVDNVIHCGSISHFHLPNMVDEERTKLWVDQIKEDVQRKRDERTKPNEASHPNIFTLRQRQEHEGDYNRPGVVTMEVQLEGLIDDVAKVQKLNTAQLRCYNLFLNGLRSLARQEVLSTTSNRCMYLGGPGGTGKSRVIQAIVTLFKRIGCPEKLIVTATTGIAANVIHGSTIHSVCHLSRGNQGDEEENRADRNRGLNLDNSWTGCEFLIIDEVSMLGSKGLNEISTNLCKLKACVQPFGGLYVLFSGDLHQLPCIGDKCLYIDSRKEPIMAGVSVSSVQKAYMTGAGLWESVTFTTVLLTEHYRAPNKTVYEVLDRIRQGRATPCDIDLIHSRTFGHANGPDPMDPKWKAAPLITPRNAVRQAWNNQAGIRYAVETGNQMFISPSKDVGVPMHYSREEMVWTVDSSTEMLATWGMLCIGAVAIVTTNVAVELGIANGTEVIIKEVVPHPDDREGWRQMDDPVVRLSRPPICVFVETMDTSDRSREFRLGKPQWFPIMTRTQRVQLPKDSGVAKTFMRTQVPLTHAFALSDHKVQGKGLPISILDLQKPPSGRFALENFYTMTSRTSVWIDMAILRPFNDDIFYTKLDERLQRYDVYLKEQNARTEWLYNQETRFL